MNARDKVENQPVAAPETGSAAAPPVLESAELFAGHNEVVIRHRGDLYRLRLTRQEKLILNK